jgi:Antitoxin SocA-like, Panacea domain
MRQMQDGYYSASLTFWLRGTDRERFPSNKRNCSMPDLLKDLTHYICWKVTEDPSKLGATKLNKALWFSDSFAYRMNGRSITNSTYIKRQFGPVPKRILPVLDELHKEGKIIIRENPYYNYLKRDFIALYPASASMFSEQELWIIDHVIAWICEEHTASSISEFSHDNIWETATEGEEIPLYAVLGAFEGEITEEDKEWASRIIAAR